MQHQITIGPSFFTKAKNDYSNWHWAFIREAMQNCIDAPRTSRITLRIWEEDGQVKVIFANNGAPMTEDIMVGKLLALGESGKDEGTGGFGKAKEVLYFTHDSYTIISGEMKVDGCGGMYDITPITNHPGTASTVRMTDDTEDGDLCEQLIKHAKAWIYMTQWKGTFILNDEELKGRFRKGYKRRTFSWATVYTNRRFQNRLIVRVNGMPMFTRHISADDRCVVVELDTENLDRLECLQSNRDNLAWKYRCQLESFVDDLTVDTSSVFKDDTPIYTLYEGDKLHTDAQDIGDLVSAAYATIPQCTDEDQDVEDDVDPNLSPVDYEAKPEESDDREAPTHYRALQRSQVNHEFVVKNTTGMVIPEHYVPASFSAYSRKLTSCWVKCLLEIHDLFGEAATFSVGFLFDADNEAEYEESGTYGKVFYINPATVVEQRWSASRSLSKRWKFNPVGKMMVLAAAVHEYVHSIGYTGHNESYSTKLTDVMAVVLANKNRFHKCFR